MSTPIRPTGRPNKRLGQTVRDMVLSLAVVLGIVAIVLVVSSRPSPEAVKVVDAAPVVGLAAAQADFPVRAPSNLPDGWRPTSARWEPTEASDDMPVLHVGFVTPEDQYALVSQSKASDSEYLAEQTAGGVMSGTIEIYAVEWETWTDGDDRRSLVLTTPESTVVVSGTASWGELSVLAMSLGPPAKP